MDHIRWLKAVTKDDSVRSIGRTADIPERTVASQVDRKEISAGNVIKIAMGYNHHPVTALIDCGYLPAKYATAADPVAALRKVSEEELADEVLRRMNLAGDHRMLTMPLDELLELRAAADGTDGGADPKAKRARLARDSEPTPTETRQAKAAAVGKRLSRATNPRKRG